MKNDDGLWKLSPSGLYNFEQCKACFWLENHFMRPPMIPFVLNSAMDSVLKSRFDFARGNGTIPPELEELTKEGIKPYTNILQLDQWRNYTSDLRFTNEEVGYELAGKLDEVLVESDGRLIPTDFKTSGYKPKEDKQKYYISQLNAYALMLFESGYMVSDRALLLHYFIKDVKNSSLSVEFAIYIDPVRLDLAAFREKLKTMIKLLNAPYPGDSTTCATCLYHKGRTSAII